MCLFKVSEVGAVACGDERHKKKSCLTWTTPMKVPEEEMPVVEAAISSTLTQTIVSN